MERQEFASILNLLDQLSSAELAEREEQVRSLRSSRKGMDALENFDQSMRDIRQYPHCGNGTVYKHGRDSRGSQRFRCRPPSQGVRKPALSECLVLNRPPREIFHT